MNESGKRKWTQIKLRFVQDVLDFTRPTPEEEVAEQMKEQIDDHYGPQIAIEICLIEAVLVEYILPGVEAGQVGALTKAGCKNKGTTIS